MFYSRGDSVSHNQNQHGDRERCRDRKGDPSLCGGEGAALGQGRAQEQVEAQGGGADQAHHCVGAALEDEGET